MRAIRTICDLNLLKIKAPAWHLISRGATLSVFTVVSLVPHNALAFESTLATSLTSGLVAEVQVERQASDNYIASPSPVYRYQQSTVIAAQSPVAVPGMRTQQSPLLAYAPQLPRAADRVLPQPGLPLVLEGEASFYSRAGCLGCNPARIMANGQPLNDNALTMAIGADKKHLVGRKVKVTSLATGQSAEVTITDTGSFHQARYGHRVADLTIATKQAIGMAGGVGQVRVEIY
jgi:rare lipoprotein A (peptidoglycan hydrolase)